MTEKGILFVITNPSAPDREGDYNEWYNVVHLPEVISCDGFKAARRYTPVEMGVPEGVPGAPAEDEMKYIAVYDMEADDLDAAVQAMFAKVQDGTIGISDALQATPAPRLKLFRQIAEASN